MSNTFLKQVAKHYSQPQNCKCPLRDMAFVFPNRRSAQQFDRDLINSLDESTFMPRIMTINDFVDHINRDNDNITASPVETMFIAYQAYKTVMGDQASDFNKFAYWGQIIVNDFNDVDMNLVDANSIYGNIADLRNISANYIEDEELRATISSILNINVHGGEGKMWKKSSNCKDGSIQDQYFTIWDKFAQIYEEFGKQLDLHGLTTQGKLYRNAVKLLEGGIDLQLDHVVMVGHDMLSMSELRIFTILNKRGIADYWWDTASPALENESNPARLVTSFARTFKQPVALDPIEQWPVIEVHNVPSVLGQAKCLFEGISSVSHDTGIVLPDETLLEPLLNSIKSFPGYEPQAAVNITMAYQLRKSNIVSLMHLIAIAHTHASMKKDVYYYYRDNVLNILSHPIIKMCFTSEMIALMQQFEQSNEFNIPETKFQDTPLNTIFKSFRTSLGDVDSVKKFINDIAAFCETVYSKLHLAEKAISNDNDNDDDDEKGTKMSLQCAFIRKYIGVLNQLLVAIDNVGLPVEGATVFHLIDRMTAGITIPFGGTSGGGLQVMGFLETRCLDFKDLHILSANEGKLPARNKIQSLFPDYLRAAFNMPTIKQADAVEAYRFYRLIARAEKLTLYYDTSNSNGSEPSRFIEQLSKIYGCQIINIKRTALVANMPSLKIEVPKDGIDVYTKYTAGLEHEGLDRCPEHNNQRKAQEKGTGYLSASSIKEYVSCPLKFYFHHIAGMKDSNDLSNFMDASTFGNIVHDTLEMCYKRADKKVFNQDAIKWFINEKLDTTLIERINYHFTKKRDDLLTPLTGQAIIMKDTLRQYVLNALKRDMELMGPDGHLTVIECEQTHKIKLKLNETEFNFNFKADRIDILNNELRIIDYKTGGDATNFIELKQLLGEDVDNNNRATLAIMQLFLYSIALMQGKDQCRVLNEELTPHMGGINHITPIIYKLRDISTSGAKQNDEQLKFDVNNFYNGIMQDFINEMEKRVKTLLDPGKSFGQAANDNPCAFCHFTDFCRK